MKLEEGVAYLMCKYIHAQKDTYTIRADSTHR